MSYSKDVKIFEKLQVLDLEAHKELRWKCLGADCPNNCCYYPTRSSIALSELESVSLFFPVVFYKVSDNRYELSAIYKLPDDEGACIYLDDRSGCTLGDLKPLSCKQYPFKVVKSKGKDTGKYFILVDLSCAGFSETSGEKVLTQTGEVSSYFRKDFLEHAIVLAKEEELTREFEEEITKLGLIKENVNFYYKNFAVKLNMIDENKLKSLPMEELKKLMEKDYLKYIYYHIHSIANMTKVIDKYIERYGDKRKG